MTVSTLPSTDTLCTIGRRVIQSEIEAIHRLLPIIGESFADACRVMLRCKGRIILLGLGKSGHIGKKIAATLASTGTPAYFIHPSEASHGDLGMITPQDVIMMISNSGETDELLQLIPLIQRLKLPIIALTGNPQSTIAQQSTHHLYVGVEKEAGSLGLAPTSSTTVALVMGDALAIALLEARGFTHEDFALYHPGGALGKRLLLQVNTLMHTGDDLPRSQPTDTVLQALVSITQKRLGMTVIVDANQSVLGIFTDGDLRRAIDQQYDLNTTQIQTVMTPHYQHITPQTLASDALHLMRQHKITSLIVLNSTEQLTGVLHMHDLLRAGIS